MQGEQDDKLNDSEDANFPHGNLVTSNRTQPAGYSADPTGVFRKGHGTYILTVCLDWGEYSTTLTELQ